MSIFDPLGIIANMLIYAKILLKEIWSRNVDWDEEIPMDLNTKWKRWFVELKSIESVSIPRCYSILIPCSDKIDLHIFVDASPDAYAAVCYLRVENSENVHVALVRAKTRVSPRRQQTIPRLELLAATLGIKLATLVIKEHSIRFQTIQFWSDSQNVLCWIRSENRKFTSFVEHRIAEILEKSDASQWRWIPSKLNVADEATKWKDSPDLTTNSRWICVPSFLKDELDTWPKEEMKKVSQILEEETVPVGVHKNTEEKYEIIPASRFSKWSKLVRMVGWMFRFSTNCKEKTLNSTRRGKCGRKDVLGQIKQIVELCPQEIRNAELILFKKVQWETFRQEIKDLEGVKHISSTSKIKRLCPQLDKEGIIRLRGRLEDNSQLPLSSNDLLF
jgi:hypothetical protein